MRNAIALGIVALNLTACAFYTWDKTHVPQQPLMSQYPASQWDQYVRLGGAFVPVTSLNNR